MLGVGWVCPHSGSESSRGVQSGGGKTAGSCPKTLRRKLQASLRLLVVVVQVIIIVHIHTCKH